MNAILKHSEMAAKSTTDVTSCVIITINFYTLIRNWSIVSGGMLIIDTDMHSVGHKSARMQINRMQVLKKTKTRCGKTRAGAGKNLEQVLKKTRVGAGKNVQQVFKNRAGGGERLEQMLIMKQSLLKALPGQVTYTNTH